MKRQKIMFMVLFFLLVCVFLPYQFLGKETQLLNGYDWEKLPYMFKHGYLKGFHMGVIRATSVTTSFFLESDKDRKEIVNSIIEKLGSADVLYKQAVESIDELYKDSSNKHIFVVYLIPLVCKKIRGEINAEKMENDLLYWRAFYSKKEKK